MIYLNPKNDLIFKKIFGENEDLCISLLNALLPLDDPIKEITYNPGEGIPDIPFMKDSIVDVRCTDVRGRQFLVEMQMQWTDSFRSRVLFNASKAYVRQLHVGDNYELLQPVYSLNLVNDIFEHDTEAFYHDYKIVNIANTEKQIKGLEFVFVELPKFKPKNISEKRMAVLWLRFLTEISNSETVAPELLAEPLICEAVKKLEIGSYSIRELEIYDRVWDGIRTKNMLWNDFKSRERKRDQNLHDLQHDLAELERMQGELQHALAVTNRKQEGFQRELEEARRGQEKAQRKQEEAMRKLIDERKKLQEEQKKRRQEKEEIARKLKALGLSAAEISQATGLSTIE
ncbi:MAG: Rpn family recombination-promoting nuclease/putative transposase [Tannerella sp.]|jgi:predicted transposase/invertase (TIGR01784 family)|nr:Rpn family recombination-promoting nuclease/putative transposase [Tannerella sp.]